MREHSNTAWSIASKFSDVRASSTRDLAAHIDVAISAERKRCADIVKAVRFGEIDGDLRSLIHRIESGDPAPVGKPKKPSDGETVEDKS